MIIEGGRTRRFEIIWSVRKKDSERDLKVIHGTDMKKKKKFMVRMLLEGGRGSGTSGSGIVRIEKTNYIRLRRPTRCPNCAKYNV